MNKAQEIIDELNNLCSEKEDIGETFIDVAIDAREDEGLPPFTTDELAQAKETCVENADKMIALESKEHELQNEYFLLTGKYPVRTDGIIPRYREPFGWE